MRTFFVLLLLANIVFFAWSKLQVPAASPASESTVAADSEQNALSIMLISEISNSNDNNRVGREGDGGKMLGGFSSSEQADALLQRLRTLSIEGVVVERVTEVSSDYLAYIPAGESKRLALRAIDELRDNGIDAALVEKGVLDNIISLGFFTQELAASNEVERAISLGFQAELEKIAQKQQRFWVRIRPESERLIDERVIETLQLDFKGMQYLKE